MAWPAIASFSRRRTLCGASLAIALAAAFVGACAAPSLAQQGMLSFPERPKPAVKPKRTGAQDQMLVRAEEINYDYTNERVAAVGNVQIYYADSSLEADRVIYDQKTKRLHASGNVRLTQADGTVTHGEIMDLSDDYRDGFVELVAHRCAGADPLRRIAGGTVEWKFHGVS